MNIWELTAAADRIVPTGIFSDLQFSGSRKSPTFEYDDTCFINRVNLKERIEAAQGRLESSDCEQIGRAIPRYVPKSIEITRDLGHCNTYDVGIEGNQKGSKEEAGDD